MNRVRSLVFTTFVLTAYVVSPGYAQELSLEKCQKLKDDIERYNQLRRHGGSGKKMDAWKRSRRRSEEAFEKAGCRRYRRQLE